MKHILKNLSIAVALSSFCFQSRAQVNDPLWGLQDIVKLAETYRNIPNLNFSIDYIFADSTNPGTPLETMSGQVKVSSGKSWTFIDSVEIIQGNQYGLTIYHYDSMMIVNDKKMYEDIMRLPILDSVFRQANVDSVAFADADTLRTLTLFFKPNSQYSKYVLVYHKLKFRLKEASFYIRDGIAQGTTAVFKVAISNYDETTPIDASIFNEWKYIHKTSGSFQAHPPYAHFTVINYSNN